ncbi:Unknown protein [Striga hermonthica]|uniref:Retrotransposon Copia-like N-terminal domain-containing protein n=1 Tax=Striga hermonthica TaxID=68872 RepID=A0A9N7RBR8_STRHE|nr:Unknown protein [Striga hermonthica]
MADHIKVPPIGSPLYIYLSDSTGTPLTQVILTGKNYSTWAKAVRRALEAKNKASFVDGSIKQPASDHTDFHWWKMGQHLGVFSQGNVPLILKAEISLLRQNGRVVTEYFTKLKGLWDELADYNDVIVCTCAGSLITYDRHHVPIRGPRPITTTDGAVSHATFRGTPTGPEFSPGHDYTSTLPPLDSTAMESPLGSLGPTDPPQTNNSAEPSLTRPTMSEPTDPNTPVPILAQQAPPATTETTTPTTLASPPEPPTENSTPMVMAPQQPLIELPARATAPPEPHHPRRPPRPRHPSARLDDYHCYSAMPTPSCLVPSSSTSSGTVYPLEHFVNYNGFSQSHLAFLAALDSEVEPRDTCLSTAAPQRISGRTS